jgi:hypothetical protein
MAKFKPCISRLACTEGGTHCKSCGRPIDHVNRTRQVIEDLAQLVIDADYANFEEFLEYVQSKAKKKVYARRERAA